MKELRIPVQSNDYVDLSIIDKDFQGLVVGYDNDKAVGYIQYGDGKWYFLRSTNYWEDNQDDSETILDLISYLISSKKCNHFKVIEFIQ